MPQLKTIFVPVDFTDSSNRATDYAVTLARKFQAKLLLIHVIEPFTYSVTDTLLVTDHYAALEAIALRMMDSLHQKLRKHDVKVEDAVMSGVPYRTIIDQARKRRADLIVMGTHGRSGLQHLLLGSVAERVVRLSTCPVLTVRGEQARRSREEKPRRALPIRRGMKKTKKN